MPSLVSVFVCLTADSLVREEGFSLRIFSIKLIIKMVRNLLMEKNCPIDIPKFTFLSLLTADGVVS